MTQKERVGLSLGALFVFILGGLAYTNILGFRFVWKLGTDVVESVRASDPDLLETARVVRVIALIAPLAATWVVWSLLINKVLQGRRNLLFLFIRWMAEKGWVKNHFRAYHRTRQVLRIVARVG